MILLFYLETLEGQDDVQTAENNQHPTEPIEKLVKWQRNFASAQNTKIWRKRRPCTGTKTGLSDLTQFFTAAKKR